MMVTIDILLEQSKESVNDSCVNRHISDMKQCKTGVLTIIVAIDKSGRELKCY